MEARLSSTGKDFPQDIVEPSQSRSEANFFTFHRSPSDGERLDFPLFGVVERQINIHGHLMGGVAEMYQCLEYIRAGLIKPWIQEIDLSEVPRYLKNFKCLRNSGKVVARINGPMSTRLVLS